jgi:hypothetical protein
MGHVRRVKKQMLINMGFDRKKLKAKKVDFRSKLSGKRVVFWKPVLATFKFFCIRT